MRSHCHWCGRYKYLEVGPDGMRVCGYCVEEPEYVEHCHRNARVDRREARKVAKGHRRPVMVYSHD